MPIYFGDKEISNILNGSTELSTIYYGDKEVWNNNAWYLKSLGTVTSYNCSNLGIDVSQLTADNFVALSQGSQISGYCEKVYSSSSTSEVSYEIIKSYSGGIINFYYHTTSRNENKATALPIYLISHQKVEGATKIKDKNKIYLGKSTSFNVTGVYSDYANLTANNFYFSGGDRSNYAEGPDVSGAGPVNTLGWITKSYNASTGILTFYNTTSPQHVVGALDVWLIV